MLLGDRGTGVRHQQLVQSQLHGQRIERLARDDLGAQLRENAFGLIGKLDVEEIRSDRLYHGIAQILQPFVVDLAAVRQNKRS